MRGGGRSCAMASFTAIRISAITRSSRPGRARGATVEGVNLFDYGCVRIFPPRFVLGVVELYRALLNEDRARLVRGLRDVGISEAHARDVRGDDTMGALHLRSHSRRPRAHRRRRRQRGGIRAQGNRRGDAGVARRGRRPCRAARVRVPRTRHHRPRRGFPRLGARLNFHRMYEDAIADFDVAAVAKRQAAALAAVGLRE